MTNKTDGQMIYTLDDDHCICKMNLLKKNLQPFVLHNTQEKSYSIHNVTDGQTKVIIDNLRQSITQASSYTR